MKGPWEADHAMKEFNKQFKAKTGSEFASRKTMVPKTGERGLMCDYTWFH